MQKPDWKDFRQALKDNNGSVAGAKTTLGKKFLQKDIDAAQREYDAQNFNEQVDEAMKKEWVNNVCGYGQDPRNAAILTTNSLGIAEQIRQGAKQK